jgi:hypothetical protein
MQQIDDSGQQHNVEAMPEDAVVQIHLRVNGWNVPDLLQLSALQKDTHRNQHKTKNKEAR